MATFSLSWEAYKHNICSGLSALQQNGEFVDMTIAADGHHVKVHQIIMSLVSPYIKELISSVQSSHPIIFLNKVSYPTLCAILEYIYTGEVHVAKENMTEVIEAAKELHIKGLQDIKLELTTQSITQSMLSKHAEGQPLSETIYFKETDSKVSHLGFGAKKKTEPHDEFYDENINNTADNTFDMMDTDNEQDDTNPKTSVKPGTGNDTRIQYTISNQGSLQMILNRFVYSLRYTSRKGPSGHRQWRCVDHRDHKCPASVITKDDVVVKRYAAHNHPFHDKKILKKVRDHAVYTAINEAEALGENKKKSRLTPTASNTDRSLLQID